MRPHPGLADAGGRADEAHHELALRLLVEVARPADLLDHAVVHHRDLVGDLHRLLLVVGDEDGRDVHLFVEAPQPFAQLRAHARVEGAERLVEQEHLGLDRERAGERHPLPLAARELGRVAVAELLQLHELEQRVDPLADLGLRPLPDRQPEGDVVAHGHVLEGGVVLEDEADAALLRGELGRVLAGDHDLARVGRLEARDHAQERRLAAAARAEQRGEGAGRHLQRDVVESDEVAEALRDPGGDDAH